MNVSGWLFIWLTRIELWTNCPFRRITVLFGFVQFMNAHHIPHTTYIMPYAITTKIHSHLLKQKKKINLRTFPKIVALFCGLFCINCLFVVFHVFRCCYYYCWCCYGSIKLIDFIQICWKEKQSHSAAIDVCTVP